VILLFGADGQFGREMADQAKRAGVHVVAVGRLQADITDRRAVVGAIQKARSLLVINAAAYTNVDRAEIEPEAAFRVNATGAGLVAEACADAGLPLVHISTDYVFDGRKRSAYREDDLVAPINVYGRSKEEGEQAVRQLNPKHFILRTAWLYGVYGQNFLKTMLRLAAERDELGVVSDQRGSPTSTVDLAKAILHIIPKLGSASWGTYHFVGGGETTWHSFAAHIVEAQARFTGRRPRVKAIATADFPTKAKRPQNSVLDSSRFAATFGFSAEPWGDATDRTISDLFVGVQQ
jgi:dTDP-4-dehydrorhamnose reductase